MITTDLSPVNSLPLHTRKEVAVGLGFDVLNGRRDSLEIDQFLTIKSVEDNSSRIFKEYPLKVICCDTAKDVRSAVELLFDSSVFQRGYSKLRIQKSALGGVNVQNISLL
jgi:hypothetical protein